MINTIHMPSNGKVLWSVSSSCCHQFWVSCLKKSGKAVLPSGQTFKIPQLKKSLFLITGFYFFLDYITHVTEHDIIQRLAIVRTSGAIFTRLQSVVVPRHVNARSQCVIVCEVTLFFSVDSGIQNRNKTEPIRWFAPNKVAQISEIFSNGKISLVIHVIDIGKLYVLNMMDCNTWYNV